MSPERDVLPERVEELRRTVAADLTAAAGDLSLCSIARSGRPMPAVKYHEGRAAMLGDVHRAFTATGIDVVRWQAAKNRWQRLTGLAADSPDWEAYLQGVKDILAELSLDDA